MSEIELGLFMIRLWSCVVVNNVQKMYMYIHICNKLLGGIANTCCLC